MARTMKRTEPITGGPYRDRQFPPLFHELREHALMVHRIRVEFFAGSNTYFRFVTEYVPGGHDPLIAIDTPERVCNVDPTRDAEHAAALAHELGHHESWLREETSEAFEELMTYKAQALYDDTANIDPALLDEVLAEEERAWGYGREILGAAVPAFDAWEQYDALAREAIDGYAKAFREANAGRDR